MSGKSEYASLNDLALSQGFTHSELLSEIHEKILDAYKERYGKNAKTVEVIVNEKSGEVHLMQDGKDVTPDGFSTTAESLARQMLISKLNTIDKKISDTEHGLQNNNLVDHSTFDEAGKWITNIFFWGYNLIYLFIAGLFLFNLIVDTSFREHTVEVVKTMGAFRFSIVALASLTPLAAIIIAFRYIGKKTYKKIGALFFLFEVPLVSISLLFSSMFRNPTPIMWFFFVLVLLAIPMFLISILNIRLRSRYAEYAELYLKEALFLTSVYLTLLFSFVFPLIFGGLIKVVTDFFGLSLFSTTPYRPFDPIEFIIILTFGGLYVLLITALAFGPYLLTGYLGKIFLKTKNRLGNEFGETQINKGVLVFGFIWIAVFAVAAYQPNPDYYIEKLGSLRETQDFEEREQIARELLSAEKQIKNAFDDLQNVRQRYLMTKNDDMIKDAYEDILNFNDYSAKMVQQVFMTMAYPFVYQGSLDNMSQAFQNFEYLFGKSYYELKKPPSLIQETKNVKLISRRIDVEKDYKDILAEITITEEYQNKTTRDQEIIYEFSLPYGSTVTDLKLGADLEFQGIIAPKGAAATVYQREVDRSRDPALLEQTGPNQYRLRVFPVPSINDKTLLQGRNQKVSFSYVTAIDANGYGLPVYSKEQNLDLTNTDIQAFVNDNSVAYNNSSVVGELDPCSVDEILTVRSDIASVSSQVIPNSQVYDNYVCSNKPSMLGSANNLRIALIFDVSYQNQKNGEVNELKNILEHSDLIQNNTVDLYKFNDILSDPIVITNNNIDDALNFIFFGRSDWIKAANDLRGGYDFAILITDSEDTTLMKKSSLKQGAPIYIVDENEIPPFTVQFTGELLQNGGSTFNNVREALNVAIIKRLRQAPEGLELIGAGNYFSYYLETDHSLFDSQDISDFTVDTDDAAAQLIVNAYVDEKISNRRGVISQQLGFMDQVTNFAQVNEIITPFSSWIALVNERQLRDLERQAQSLDRYRDSTSTVTRQPMPTLFGEIGSPASSGDLNMLNLGPQGQFQSPGRSGLLTGGSGTPLGMGSLFSQLILINVLLLGGGIVLFAIYKTYSRFRSKK